MTERRVIYRDSVAAGREFTVEALPDRNGAPSRVRMHFNPHDGSGLQRIEIGPAQIVALHRALGWLIEEIEELGPVPEAPRPRRVVENVDRGRCYHAREYES